MPKWNTISISGYHMAEAGATPAQEIAFTLADGIEYVRAAIAAGQDVDDFAPRLAFFFVSRTSLLEEVAKFRAARRIWARVMREQFGATNPKSMMLRFHTQTAGVQLTAQQPEVNMVRVAVQALAAVLGGTQSLHTNSFDEAIALPTEKAARLALRTQQVIAYESDVCKTVDPFAGSYAVESLTDDLEAAAMGLLDKVDDLGGAVAAIEQGFQKAEIERSAYRIANEIDAGERVVVGVNRFTIDTEEPYEPLRVDPSIEAEQRERLARLRADRGDISDLLEAVRAAARGTENVLVPDEGRPARPRDRRGGQRRPSRRVGRVHACRRVLIGRSGRIGRARAIVIESCSEPMGFGTIGAEGSGRRRLSLSIDAWRTASSKESGDHMKARMLAVAGAAALLLAACGQAPDDSGSASGSAAESDFLGCMVTDQGGIDDRSFNASAWKGLQQRRPGARHQDQVRHQQDGVRLHPQRQQPHRRGLRDHRDCRLLPG